MHQEIEAPPFRKFGEGELIPEWADNIRQRIDGLN